jgi:pimeloyl-ACP methyl ester carboxylesterase
MASLKSPAPVAGASPGEGFEGRFFRSQDGLKLHYRDYGPCVGPRLPVVCLPGLSRNGADFHELALALAGHRTRPRRILALDSRGRGRSDRDPNWRNYDLRVELGDVLALLPAAGVAEAVFVGTSRGGILTMLIGAARAAALRGAVINDIGPVIEGAGLARIKGYVGKLPTPRTMEEAIDILKTVSGGQFSAVGEADWRRFAERTFRMTPKGIEPDYDPALSKGLDALDFERPLPTLWPQFESLRHAPVLSIRGENSDIFAATTQAEMAKRHPGCQTLTVPGQGHAPLLADGPSIEAIQRMCEDADRAVSHH